MKRASLEDMVRGWFVGDFEPTIFPTTDVEIGVKKFAAGEREERHVHKVATEITAIIEGSAEMEGVELAAGDIVVVEPGEAAGFRAITDVTLVVAKLPGAKDDKFPA